jgi:hypothetical protein
MPVINPAIVADRVQLRTPERTLHTMVRADNMKKAPRIDAPTHLWRVASSTPKNRNNAGGRSENTQ